MARLALACLLAALSLPAAAQYAGPGVQACQAYSERELLRNGLMAVRIVIDVDSDLLVEKTTQKVGSQAVTLMLRGNGALLLDGHPPTELTFLCLLADDKRAVFFDWLQRRDAPVLAQCRRGASQPAQPAQLEACFARLRQLADYDLLAAGTSRFQAAIEADSASGGARAEAFRAADAAWRAYRDTECRGRREGAGADAANAEKACLIQLDIRRARELRMAR